MMWRTILVTFLAVGVLAEYKVTNDQRQQFKDIVKKMCKKAGAEDKVESIETAVKNFVDCLNGLFDVEVIKKEIEDAKPKGALDEVFKKYCAKTAELKTCIHTVMDSVTPCLDASVEDHVASAKNGINQLIDFVCYKDGDRIALFIAEAGPECFQQKSTEIRGCVDKIKENITSSDDFKQMTVDQRCHKYDELSSCIVKSLEECNTPTPGNMAESLLRYIRKSSPCNSVVQKN